MRDHPYALELVNICKNFSGIHEIGRASCRERVFRAV